MKELAIYIHLPFCVQKCLYCDFLSGPSYLNKIEEYLDMLCIEMNQYRKKIQDYRVRSIFLGGGTPSILKERQITKVMGDIYQVIGDKILPDAEITVESNPGTLTEEKLEAYLKIGINRISMGLQSTHNDELKKLGRIHTYEEFVDGYKLARKVGFQNINIDLMSGLPDQTMEKFETTLRRITELNPEHISAYSLIIEENTKFYEAYGTKKGSETLPDEEVDRLMYQKTKEILASAGYERYEISNYAKPGYESRHNCSYWTGIEYLGIGLGASSYFDKKRYHNEENMAYYMETLTQNGQVRFLEEELSVTDEMEEFMILGLRLVKGVSKKEFTERFQKQMEEVYGKTIEKLLGMGLMQQNGDRLALTDRGIDVSNEIFLMFME